MALTLHYDFKSNPSLDPTGGRGKTLTFTRSGIAKAMDDLGYLRDRHTDEAEFPGSAWYENRISYQTGIDSEDLTTWGATECSVLAAQDSVVYQGKTVNLSEITDNATSSNHFVRIFNQYPNAVGVNAEGMSAVLSVIAKAGTLNYVGLQFANTPGAATFFNLSNGTVVNPRAAEDDGIEDLGDGYYRCYVQADYNTAGGFSGNDVLVLVHEDGTGANYSGGTGTVFAGGVQYEIKSGAWDAQNLFLQSEALDTSPNSLGQATLTGSKPDPDGGFKAWALNEDNTAAAQHLVQQSALTVNSGDYLFFGIRAKASNRDWLMLAMDYKGAGETRAYFDLANGVEGTQSPNLENTGMSSLGDGWYFCWLLIESDTSTNILKINAAEADQDVTFDGLNQESLLLYRPQIERARPNQVAPGPYLATTTNAQSSYSPSPYIPTSNARESVVSGANRGYFNEQAATNLLLHSEDFTNVAGWSTSQSALNADLAIAPDGSLSMDQLIDDNATGVGLVRTVSVSTTVSTSTTYTMSVYAKRDQLSWIQFRWINNVVDPFAFFDLDNGVVGATTGAGNDAQGIEDVGNGVYRCWVAFTSDGADTAGNVAIACADADNDANVDRDGTSSVYLWGAVLEETTSTGHPPTSYIKTTTATVTRNNSVNNSTALTATDVNQAQGTIYVDVEYPLVVTNQLEDLVDIGTDANNGYQIRYRGDNATEDVDINVRTLAVNEATSLAASVLSDEVAKISARYNTNDVRLYADGVAGAQDSTVSLPVQPTSIRVGSRLNGALPANCFIREIRVYDEAFTDQELEDLSNGQFPSDTALYPMGFNQDFLFGP